MNMPATRARQSFHRTYFTRIPHNRSSEQDYSDGLRNAKFVKCDVRNWDDQVATFEAAIASSPHHSVDIVIANAGIVGADQLNDLNGEQRGPLSIRGTSCVLTE